VHVADTLQQVSYFLARYVLSIPK